MPPLKKFSASHATKLIARARKLQADSVKLATELTNVGQLPIAKRARTIASSCDGVIDAITKAPTT